MIAPVQKEQSRHEEAFLSLILGNPSILSSLGLSLTPDMFTNEMHQRIFHSLCSGTAPSECAPQELFDRLILLFDQEYGTIEEKEQKRIAQIVGVHIRERAVKKRVQELKNLMEQAERVGDHGAVERYTREFSSLVQGR